MPSVFKFVCPEHHGTHKSLAVSNGDYHRMRNDSSDWPLCGCGRKMTPVSIADGGKHWAAGGEQ